MHVPNPPKERDFFPNSHAEITVQDPFGRREVVKLDGPTTVLVCIDDSNGFAADTDGNGRDQVPTQMTQLDLAGVSTLLGGPVRIRLDATRPTIGKIEEQVNNTRGTLDVMPFTAAGQADSSFEVFPEFIIGNQVFHTAQALHMETVITHKPPAPVS